MKVKVLFFGATADVTGRREIYFELGDDSNVELVRDLLSKEYPVLENRKLLFSVNQEYSEAGTPIKDGDELAIFTPVSGG